MFCLSVRIYEPRKKFLDLSIHLYDIANSFGVWRYSIGAICQSQRDPRRSQRESRVENHSRNGLGANKWNDREGLVLMLIHGKFAEWGSVFTVNKQYWIIPCQSFESISSHILATNLHFFYSGEAQTMKF